jgi:hypothetical protein
MKDMTDDEAEYWDNYFTEHPPVPDPDSAKVGVTARGAGRLIAVDGFTEKYLIGKALATHKTPAEVVSDLVRRELAAIV